MYIVCFAVGLGQIEARGNVAASELASRMMPRRGLFRVVARVLCQIGVRRQAATFKLACTRGQPGSPSRRPPPMKAERCLDPLPHVSEGLRPHG